MAFRPPAERRPPGRERNVRQSVRPDIPMSPNASSMSDEADTLDRSHLHGLKGSGGHSFSVPGDAALPAGGRPFGTCEICVIYRNGGTG